MTTILSDSLQQSLALVSACGQSVRSWAKRHDFDCETAYEWSIQNDFRAIVEVTRLRVADRMVGRLMRGSGFAIDQLVRLCRRGTSEAIRLSASRTILTHWVPISRHFFVKGKLRELKEIVNTWETKGHYRTPSGPWRPPAPQK